MRVLPHVFREYDIRGNVERDLTADFVRLLGQALGEYWQARGAHRIVLGRDCRLHSSELRSALLQGLARTSCQITDIGIVPSPMLYFAVHQAGFDGGVEITGSHNPKEDNGFKILLGKEVVCSEELQVLKNKVAQLSQSNFEELAPVVHRDIGPEYLDFINASLKMGKRRFKIVVDGGNGTGGQWLVKILQGLGYPVISLFCNMDGNFPNHHPDPTMPENLIALQKAVQEHQAEVGLALDGDADRLGAVDAQGRIIWGDQLLLLLAQAVLKETPGATFLAEVKCSRILFAEIQRQGGQAIMWKVGHALLKRKMKELNAALGGEMSGHFFFAHRYLGYDDGIYAGARLIELLSQTTKSLSEMVDEIPLTYNTPEQRLDLPELKRVPLMTCLKKYYETLPDLHIIDIDGLRLEWKDGWALIRPSNTQPMLVMRFEADTPQRLQQIQENVLKTVKTYLYAA